MNNPNESAVLERMQYYYHGEGLDEAAVLVQRVLFPMDENPKPDHAVQVAIRMLIDRMRYG